MKKPHELPGLNYLETYRAYIKEGLRFISPLFDANGNCIPATQRLFKVGEYVAIKDTTFRVAYLNDSTVVLESLKSLVIKSEPEEK
jgi:hypothetical protein